MEYLIAFLIAYAYLAFCIQTIAKKTGTENALNAWIPVLNFILVAKIAQKPNWLGLLLLIPVVNFAIAIYLLIEIIKITQKPAWLGLLLIFPGLGLIVPGYVAFSSGTAPVSKNIGNLIMGMIVASIVLAIAVFYVFTLMPIQETIKANNAYSTDEIAKLQKQAKSASKTIVIDNLKKFHEDYRKARIGEIDVMNMHDKALEMQFPGVNFSDITAFKTKMNVFVSALNRYYSESIKMLPPVKEGRIGGSLVKYDEEPFEQLKKDLDSEENCRLALKKCLIVTEILNALKTSIDKLQTMSENAEDEYAARFKNNKPICAFIKLDFPGLTTEALAKEKELKGLSGYDGTKLYRTLPFKLEMACDPELYALFYREISVPKELNVEPRNLDLKVNEEEAPEDFMKRELTMISDIFKADTNGNELKSSFAEAVRQRYGLRFDFMYSKSEISEFDENLELGLLTNKEVLELYKDQFPKMIGKDPSKPLPPKGEDPKDHVGRWAKCYLVQSKLTELLTAKLPLKPSYLIAEVGGAAIDFTLEAVINNVLYEEQVKAGAIDITSMADGE